MVECTKKLAILSLLLVLSVVESNEDNDHGKIFFDGFSLHKPTLSIMYRLCNVRSPAQTNQTTECINWFLLTVDHCAGVFEVDPNRIAIFERMTNWIMPSFKTLINFSKITDTNPEALTETDCKLLLTKLARDYIIRGPHYQLASYTLQSLWAILCLIMTTMTLIALSTLSHRVYVQFLKPHLEEREKCFKYLEHCATEIGAAKQLSLVTVNRLMKMAIYEAK